MNLYEYQRSRSLIDLHPRSLRFTFSNFFSLETFRPIEARFHVEPLWDRWLKVCSNSLCHMTSMAAMPIYGKNLKKSSSLEPKGHWPWNLVCNIGYSSNSKFVQMMTMSWPWPILRQGQIWSLMLRRKTYHELKIRQTEKVKIERKENEEIKAQISSSSLIPSGTHNSSAHCPRVYQVSTFKASQFLRKVWRKSLMFENWRERKMKTKGMSKQQQQPDSGIHDTSAHCPYVCQVSTF